MKKLLILIHGSKEHHNRYDNLIKNLNSNNIQVHTGDLASHGSLLKGKSHNFTFKEMLNSALNIIDEANNKYPKHEKIIFGHSMGSFIVKYIVYNNLRTFDKVILSGTNNTPSILTNSAIVLTSIFRKNKVNRLTEKLSYGGLEAKSKRKGYGSNWLSTDINNEEDFKNDPLCGNPFTNQSLNSMFKFIKGNSSKKTLKNFNNKKIPQLVIYGELDPVTNFGKEIKSMIKKHNKYGINNHKVISYKGCKHEIAFDILKEDVERGMVEFILNNK